MNKTFTTTDLILFAFNETLLSDTVFIVKALEQDFYLQAEFEEVIETIHYIDMFNLGPSNASLDAILKYSRSKVTY
jgi:predicted nucleic-acid-binding protein